MRGRPAMNPPTWSLKAYDNLWQQWGLTEKPADFERLVRARYGLHPAPYDNGGLPMGLHQSQGLLGKGVASQADFDQAENDLRSAEQAHARREISVPWAPINALLTGLLLLESAWLRHLNSPFGSSLVCLARKPT